MTTEVRIPATKAAVIYEASITAGTSANFGANSLGINERIDINRKTGTLTGTHDGSSNVAVLTDSGEDWGINQFIGYTLTNTTDSSSTTVTSNTSNTITGVLAGGGDNDWDAGDAYTLTGFVLITFVEAGGLETAARLEFKHNTRRVAGAVDLQINKPVTKAAVEVVEYT